MNNCRFLELFTAFGKNQVASPTLQLFLFSKNVPKPLQSQKGSFREQNVRISEDKVEILEMFKLVFAIAIINIVSSSTPITECDNGQAMPDAVFFNSRQQPCLSAPCEIVRSSGRGVAYVNFTTSQATKSIKPRVRAKVWFFWITQDLPEVIESNPCRILEAPHECPLAANQKASYRLELPVASMAPLMTVDTEVTLFDDNSKPIFCYRLKTKIIA
jgi:hypothetical protein